MPRCCGQATCACVIQPGTGITITGSGTSQDPFIITAGSPLSVADNLIFDLTLNPANNQLSVNYAPTAKLDDIPDVNAAGPTNGQVLGWDSATSRWTARAPTTAASGSVLHNTSLSGDGSAGTPLAVVVDTARAMVSGATGVGLSDAGINQLVRGFANDSARTSANPAPDMNTLSMLDTVAGEIDYWDGTSWQPVKDKLAVDVAGEFMALSGPYGGTDRLTLVVRQVNTISDASGIFTVLDAATIGGYAGLVSVQFQESGSSPWKAVCYPDGDHVSAVAYQLLDPSGGLPWATQAITGTVQAWAY
jgi:hypothetical protein